MLRHSPRSNPLQCAGKDLGERNSCPLLPRIHPLFSLDPPGRAHSHTHSHAHSVCQFPHLLGNALFRPAIPFSSRMPVQQLGCGVAIQMLKTLTGAVARAGEGRRREGGGACQGRSDPMSSAGTQRGRRRWACCCECALCPLPPSCLSAGFGYISARFLFSRQMAQSPQASSGALWLSLIADPPQSAKRELPEFRTTARWTAPIAQQSSVRCARVPRPSTDFIPKYYRGKGQLSLRSQSGAEGESGAILPCQGRTSSSPSRDLKQISGSGPNLESQTATAMTLNCGLRIPGQRCFLPLSANEKGRG